MPTYQIAGREIVVLSILVLYLGSFITDQVGFLRRKSIPASVTGGLICSVVVALLAGFGVIQLTFDLELRNLLLLLFFSTIGLNAKFRSLAKGGLALLALVAACAVYLVIQNTIGVLLVTAMGQESVFGLFGGSISLTGGHGTAIAWGQEATRLGIPNASEFGIACATLGLILGGLLGGPLAGRLIVRHELKSHKTGAIYTDKVAEPKADAKRWRVTIEDFINTVLALALCLGIGDAVNHYLFSYEIRLPGFVTAMAVGVVITNLVGPLKIKLRHNAIDIVGGISLQLFLTMRLMSMNLLSLADSALQLVVLVAIQSIAILFFASLVVFRIMGRNYDAAVISGGFVGLGLGAIPVAMASMDAVSAEYGPSAKALLVVPLVGAFFIDLINAGLIATFLRWLL